MNLVRLNKREVQPRRVADGALIGINYKSLILYDGLDIGANTHDERESELQQTGTILNLIESIH